MLLPCSACARHFRIDERRCPFCDAPSEAPAVTQAVTAQGALRGGSSRPWTRAALVFMGATALGACSKERGEVVAPVVSNPPTPVDVQPVDAGAPPPPSSAHPAPTASTAPSSSSTSSVAPDAGRSAPRPRPDVVPLYGVPPLDENP